MSLTFKNRHTWLAVVIGLLAGLLAGMFGVGGGFLMVPLYISWLGPEQRKSHATSLAAVVPIALAGAIGYAGQGSVDFTAAISLLAGSVFGALYGVKLLGQVPLKFLQFGFATLLYLSAIRLIWSSNPHQLLDGWASIALLMAGLFGVGGGLVMVPALIIAAGMNSIVARGTSLVVIVGSGLSGTWANFRKGNIDISYALLSGLAGIPSTFLGVYVSHQISQRITVIMFTILLLAIATQQVQKARGGSAVH